MQIYISRSEKNGISKQQYLSCKYIICISVSIFWKFSLKAFRNKFFCNINIARLNNILQQRYGERGEKEEKEIFCVQKRRIYPLCREGEYIRRVEKKNIFCILKRQSTGKQKMGTGRFECKSYYYFRKRFLLILTLHHFHITLVFFVGQYYIAVLLAVIVMKPCFQMHISSISKNMFPLQISGNSNVPWQIVLLTCAQMLAYR